MLKIIDDNFNLHVTLVPEQVPGMQVNRLAGLVYVDSGLSCDTFNIIHITDSRLFSEQDFRTAIAHFKNKNFAYCTWINQENLTAEVQDIFQRMNIVEQNTEEGMILDLSKYGIVDNPLHANIHLAKTKEHIKDFAEVIALNWTPPDENIRKYFSLTADTYLTGQQEIMMAVYYQDNQPVSVIELFGPGKETIGLYSLATRSTYRGKGIGTAVMTIALNLAKNRGYKNVILQASEDGIGIYTKLGFRVITKFYEYA